jgi:nucleoside-diphosphate-sugar epimerase
MGFDPMMQVIHEDDVVAALIQAVKEDVPGAFNVAATDALPLSRIRGLMGKVPISVFHPFANWGLALLGTARLDADRYLPIEPDYLRFPWVGDLARMHAELGFAPGYTAIETLREFAAHLRLGRYRMGPTGLAHNADHMRQVIERRGYPQPHDSPDTHTAMERGDDE